MLKLFIIFLFSFFLHINISAQLKVKPASELGVNIAVIGYEGGAYELSFKHYFTERLFSKSQLINRTNSLYGAGTGLGYDIISKDRFRFSAGLELNYLHIRGRSESHNTRERLDVSLPLQVDYRFSDQYRVFGSFAPNLGTYLNDSGVPDNGGYLRLGVTRSF